MRFDLEINIVSQLTKTGLKTLSEMFYDEDSGNKIAPANWDSKTTISKYGANAGGVNTSKFLDFIQVPDYAFSSGVDTLSTLALTKLVVRENMICPMFVGGEVLFHRYGYRWSKNVITKKSQYINLYGTYVCEIDEDTDEDTVQVHTLRLSDPGYIGYFRNFEYVPYTRVRVVVLDKQDSLPVKANINTIYICKDTYSVFESTRELNLKKTLQISEFRTDVPSSGYSPANGTVVVINDEHIFKYYDGSWSDIAVDRTFATSTSDYKFTIKTDPATNKRSIFTNMGKIEYIKISLGTAIANERVIAGLPEFPIFDNIVIDEIDGTNQDLSFKVLNSAVLVTNKTEDDIEITASFTAYPIVSYRQKAREELDDTVYRNINISPAALKFKNGLLCVYNSFTPTIDTKDGGHIPIPIKLNLRSDKSELSIMEGVKITARLYGMDDIPIKGAKISFKVVNKGQDVVKWLSSDNNNYNGFTGLDGAADSILISTRGKYGWYIQKEWVQGRHITVPFNIMTEDISRMYLYIITADDPILGKLGADTLRGEVPTCDYYTAPGRLDSYEINGRKIAYIKMNTGYSSAGKWLRSSFIKPTSMLKITKDNNESVWIRNSYIKDYKNDSTIAIDKKTILGNVDGTQFSLPVPALETDVSMLAVTGWDNEWLINPNVITIQKVLINNGTRLIFDSEIPGQNIDRVVGYWLITGSGGTVDVVASFEDEATGIKLYSEKLTINIVNYIKSEYEFIIGGSELENQNSTLGSFGYYTVSEYLKNPLGITSCTYACVHSDASSKSENKCIHKNSSYHKYYSQEENEVTCKLTPEYYRANGISPLDWCPGMEVGFVNPFIMKAEK